MRTAAQADRPVTWYVAQTKPRREHVARENLVRQGYGVYLPRIRVLKQRRKRQEIGYEPLFPRYVFFQPCHIEHSIAPVHSTQGVTAIVRFGGVPAVLRSDTIAGIRTFECRQNAADLAELRALQPGKSVVVTAGALAGLEGLVATVSAQRVIVLMRLLGEETRVSLSPSELRLAP